MSHWMNRNALQVLREKSFKMKHLRFCTFASLLSSVTFCLPSPLHTQSVLFHSDFIVFIIYYCD